ncbi:beta/gamma crystallin-related protein [Pseudoduganella violaceinigra]|uniref:beta/gamma crystallin-related protein n=1 Tax=Pseudoduganella violaceinigra TaxID=246602 RepID=UPI0003FDA87A|nr:beta/gamma crystallin-related protein [Pseudoduganella violaceinigra]
MKNTLTAAFLLAASIVGQAASAGELLLFSHEDFRGERVTIADGAASNFTDFGFNDRASSIVVRSGTWELCEHKDFGGQCAVFERGEYPNLRQFNNQFSSAREIQGGRRDRGNSGYGYGRDDRDYRDYRDERREERRDGRWMEDRREERRDYRERGDAVEMYNDVGFRGRHVVINNDMHTLRDVGFNDNANSLVINYGTWQVCEHADYGGQCRTYGPGRYPNLEDFIDRISSIRRVR